jgi:Transposase DDE domain group 1
MRLQLHVLAHNLGNFMRSLAMPKTAQPWSLTSQRDKLIKIGAEVVSHARYVTFQMAEVAVPRQMFADILSLIARLRGTTHAHRRGRRDRCGKRQQRRCAFMRSEVARLRGSPWSTRGFDRLLLAARAIRRCSSRSRERSWPRTGRGSGECRL